MKCKRDIYNLPDIRGKNSGTNKGTLKNPLFLFSCLCNYQTYRWIVGVWLYRPLKLVVLYWKLSKSRTSFPIVLNKKTKASPSHWIGSSKYFSLSFSVVTKHWVPASTPDYLSMAHAFDTSVPTFLSADYWALCALLYDWII